MALKCAEREVYNCSYTALGLVISRKSGLWGWNLEYVATMRLTLSTWTRPPSSSRRFCIIYSETHKQPCYYRHTTKKGSWPQRAGYMWAKILMSVTYKPTLCVPNLKHPLIENLNMALDICQGLWICLLKPHQFIKNKCWNKTTLLTQCGR